MRSISSNLLCFCSLHAETPLLTRTALVCSGASVEPGAAPPRTLIVEGAEADDVAAYVCRAAAGAPDSNSNANGAADRPVILLTSDRDWLQYMERPSVHCLDLLGAVRRPEWLQADGASAGGAATGGSADGVNAGPVAARREAYARVAAAVQGEAALARWAGERDVAGWLCRNAAHSETWQAVLVRATSLRRTRAL
jgi:hypothetical protein